MKRELVLDNKKIGEGQPPFIIAEIGINHQGDVGIAKEMIQEAALCGVQSVKFQIINPDRAYAKNSVSYPIFKKYELSPKEWEEIFKCSQEEGIIPFATFVDPRDLEDYSFLDSSVYKVSSTNLTNFPLLEALGQKGKSIILSTGMSYLSEVDEAVRCLEDHGAKDIAVLQCTSLYPTQDEEAELRVIQTLRSMYPSRVIGFSDHTDGNYASFGAMALGASIFEKHFTLDKEMEGPDHEFSADPSELLDLVEGLNRIHKALGRGIKEPQEREIPWRDKYQRSIVCEKDLEEGETLKRENLGIKRSQGRGLAPKYLNWIEGRITKKTKKEGDPLLFEDIG